MYNLSNIFGLKLMINGLGFVKIAHLIYINNDKRSEIKKKIKLLLGSGIVEQKSYPKYQDE